uniref:Si:ch211-191j22.3 n=1 Tax=Echeneis naucrates TaxID=173247 RepID=A0A665VQJ8_ECHNA
TVAGQFGSAVSGMSGSEGGMTNVQLLQQMAFLRWLSSQTDEDRRILAAVTGFGVGRELLNRLSSQDKVDSYKRDCILAVSEFVRQNPRASQAQINTEVEKRVLLFAAQVKALETALI